MKQDKLISAIASRAGLSQKAVKNVLNELTYIVTDQLKKDDSVSIYGFGTFKVSKRSARNGVNPKTLEKITIPAMSIARFVAGAKLKSSLR